MQAADCQSTAQSRANMLMALSEIPQVCTSSSGEIHLSVINARRQSGHADGDVPISAAISTSLRFSLCDCSTRRWNASSAVQPR